MATDLPHLIAALTAPNPAVRSPAAEELSHLGPDARPAAITLVQACGDESEEVREWAVAALEELAARPGASLRRESARP
jgi:HEAT repeat protein